MNNEQKPKSASDPLFYKRLQPEVVKLTRAQQARQDQIALAGRARLANLSARLEAVRPKPEPEPEPETMAGVARHSLPAVIPAQPPPATWSDLLTVMNNQHAIIDNVGGKTVIASWEPSSLDPTRLIVAFQNKESFLLRYSNRCATIEITNKNGGIVQTQIPLSGWWLTHRHRRQYRGITFWPGRGKVVNDCLNLWRGWGCEAQEGDWSLIRDHIETVLASGNAEFSEYLIRWIAWSIQNPDKQAEVAVVLIGAKGSGKGTLVRLLERIFGQHCFQVSSREEVIGKFNGHLQDCILFIADEAYWGGDKRCVGRLQAMITEPKLTIERKGIDAFEVRNLLHILMLAEPGWVIPAGRYERRYAAFAVSTVKRGNRAYFRDLHDQIHNGGAEAMFYDLQRDTRSTASQSSFAEATDPQSTTTGTMVSGSLAQRQASPRKRKDTLRRPHQSLDRRCNASCPAPARLERRCFAQLPHRSRSHGR
jgi:energy-coupling factor transporter ATP-binding protein EcfA2